MKLKALFMLPLYLLYQIHSKYRKCTDTQRIFQELSSEVMKISMDAATNFTKATYSNCKLDVSWQESNSPQYQDCTTEISKSNARIYGNLQAIEVFAANNILSTLAIQKHL